MWSEDRFANQWTGIGALVADVRRKLACGTVADEADVRAEIANALHAAVNLFEVEVRRMAGRDRPV
jgi:hypothetical protein